MGISPGPGSLDRERTVSVGPVPVGGACGVERRAFPDVVDDDVLSAGREAGPFALAASFALAVSFGLTASRDGERFVDAELFVGSAEERSRSLTTAPARRMSESLSPTEYLICCRRARYLDSSGSVCRDDSTPHTILVTAEPIGAIS